MKLFGYPNVGRYWQREPHFLEPDNPQNEHCMIVYDYQNWSLCLSGGLEEVLITRANNTLQFMFYNIESYDQLLNSLENKGYVGKSFRNKKVDIYKNEKNKPYIATIDVDGLWGLKG